MFAKLEFTWSIVLQYIDYLVACVVIFPNIASSLSSKTIFHSLRHSSNELIDNLSCSELISSSLSLAIDE